MEQKIDTSSDEQTQQISVLDGRNLTYREFLTKTLVSVNQALNGK